jgi:AraC-like DNA-binding protein
MMLYRDWLNLNIHLLWCHDRCVAEGQPVSGSALRFTEFTNSAAWLVCEGWARVEHDGQKHTARPGEWLLVKPGPRVQTFSRDTRILSIAFDARWPDGSHLYDEGLSMVIDSSEVPILERKVRPILNAMKIVSPDTWDVRGHPVGLDRFLRLERLLYDWLIAYSGVLEERGVAHSGHEGVDPRVRSALDLLHARGLAEPFDLDWLANAVGASSNHLVRLFQRDLQTTPHRYWERLRMESACSRLALPNTRIKEVSIELGFNYLSHFSKWFKRHRGKTPTEVRRNGNLEG